MSWRPQALIILSFIAFILKFLSVSTVKKRDFLGSKASLISSSVMRAPFSERFMAVRAVSLEMTVSVSSFIVRWVVGDLVEGGRWR